MSVDGQALSPKGYCPVQLVFQNPELAVNPHWRIRQILAESHPPDSHWLDTFGIHPGWLSRYPHELSGGELQRVAIARILNPATRYLITDEMTAMLDANTQALIWQGVLAFVRQQQVGLIMISHNQSLLKRICVGGASPKENRISDLGSDSTALNDLSLREQLEHTRP